MTLPDTTPTRKQRFDAALKLAGVTFGDWCDERDVTVQHVNYVLAGERRGGPELNAAIDALIERYLIPAARQSAKLPIAADRAPAKTA
jgi:hypothetical protein